MRMTINFLSAVWLFASLPLSSSHPDILYGSLFEGDIAGIDSIKDFVDSDNRRYQNEQFRRSYPSSIQRNAVRDRNLLWPDGRVPYVLSDRYSREEKRTIWNAMKEFHQNTCVRFVPRTSEHRYLNIYPSGGGCYSRVGRAEEGGSQELSLERVGCIEHDVIVHELMHTIGFFHEQARADRDSFVNVHLENVVWNMERNFQKYDLQRIRHLDAPYDYGSIMHYDRYAFTRNGLPTITKKRNEGPAIGQQTRLSPWDKYKINKLYKCPDRGGETAAPTTDPPAPSTPPPPLPRPPPTPKKEIVCQGITWVGNYDSCCRDEAINSETEICVEESGHNVVNCEGVRFVGHFDSCCGMLPMNSKTDHCQTFSFTHTFTHSE